jgi:hypothetical protein
MLASLLLLVPAQAPDAAGAFLARLTGSWRGVARVTERSRRIPYRLRFARPGAGVARVGDRTTHRWTFRRQGARLRLRFSSDFTGEELPTHLESREVRPDHAVFCAARCGDVKVVWSAAPRSLRARIYLRGALHVDLPLRAAGAHIDGHHPPGAEQPASICGRRHRCSRRPVYSDLPAPRIWAKKTSGTPLRPSAHAAKTRLPPLALEM